MPSPATPGVCLAIPVQRGQRGLRDVRTHSARPISHHPLQVGLVFGAFTVRHCYGLPACSPSWRITRGPPRVRRLLHPCLSTRRSPGSTMGMTTSVSGHLRWRDCPARRTTERRCTLTNQANRPNSRPDGERGREIRGHEGYYQIVAVGSALSAWLGMVKCSC